MIRQCYVCDQCQIHWADNRAVVKGDPPPEGWVTVSKWNELGGYLYMALYCSLLCATIAAKKEQLP